MNKVMLIEDDETMLSLIQTLLEMEGFEVVRVECIDDLELTLSEVRQELPDLVLLDVHLRCFNGLDLLQRLRQEQGLKGTRVLMSSGMELSFECGQQGADGFILKPFMPDELVSKIRATIQGS
jgi:DNA-binding response OmpR family regulator